MPKSKSNASLDILVPVFNEHDALEALFSRLSAVFPPDALAKLSLIRVRVVFIDDGSTDGSAELIAERLRQGFPGLLLQLSRNFGHQAALTAGLDSADADFVAVIDADLQDPPELLPAMLEKCREGFDIVYGQRRRRDANPFKKVAYWLFYRLLAAISEVRLPLDAGDFCILSRRVVLAMGQLPEKLRFHRGLRSWIGFRQAAFPYDRPERQAGASKYSLAQLYRLATDGVASMSIRPLQIMQGLLFLSVVVTISFLGASLRLHAMSGRHDPLESWFLATQSLVALTASLQLLCFHLLGAYVSRTYLEVKARPSYIVMDTVDSAKP